VVNYDGHIQSPPPPMVVSQMKVSFIDNPYIWS
jgi:hypothetical protein